MYGIVGIVSGLKRIVAAVERALQRPAGHGIHIVLAPGLVITELGLLHQFLRRGARPLANGEIALLIFRPVGVDVAGYEAAGLVVVVVPCTEHLCLQTFHDVKVQIDGGVDGHFLALVVLATHTGDGTHATRCPVVALVRGGVGVHAGIALGHGSLCQGCHGLAAAPVHTAATSPLYRGCHLQAHSEAILDACLARELGGQFLVVGVDDNTVLLGIAHGEAVVALLRAVRGREGIVLVGSQTEQFVLPVDECQATIVGH